MARGSHLILQHIYARLYKHFGPQHWWPARTRFEVVVGAVLTQNTNWSNVEKALENLRRRNLLNFSSLNKIPPERLGALIKPSGYFNVKAKRLKNLISFISREYGGSLPKMMRRPLAELRETLLKVNGIGPETADSILLYALDKPTFVVDSYTKRILGRHRVIDKTADYPQVQELFMAHLPHRVRLFNEYHALIVHTAKTYCKKRPLCDKCPLWGLGSPPPA